MTPPTLRNVILADLGDVARLLALHQQAIARGWLQGELFLGVKLVDPTWTRARWKQAQATLAQWQQQQGRARGQGSGMEPLGDAPDEVSKADEDD